MTIEANFAAAQQEASPEVFRFTCGSRVDRYTSDTQQVIFQGEIYDPASIERGEFTEGSELSAVPVRITAGVTAFFRSFVANAPLEATRVKCWRVLHSDPSESVFVFGGVMLGIGFGKNVAAMEFESQRHVLRRRCGFLYQAFCNHEVFDVRCGLSRAVWQVSGTVAAISGATLTVSAAAAFDADYFTGGYIEAGTDARFITGHTTDQIDMQMAFDGRVVVGTPVLLYPGCSGDPAVCDEKFNNLGKFFGMPYIDKHNPAIWGFRGHGN